MKKEEIREILERYNYFLNFSYEKDYCNIDILTFLEAEKQLQPKESLEVEEFLNSKKLLSNQIVVGGSTMENSVVHKISDLLTEYATQQSKVVSEVETKFHYAREIVFTLRSNHSINNDVYLHWLRIIDKQEQLTKKD